MLKVLILLILILIIIKISCDTYIIYELFGSMYLQIYYALTVNDNKYLYQNFNNIFKNIQSINKTNFNEEFKINAYRDAINQYKIINLYDYKNLFTNIIKHNKEEETSIKKIIELCLPNITINGKQIDINRCVIVDILYSDIQTFPLIHTDIEWGAFDKSDGFQLWYLYKNDDTVGNMFIIETDKVKPSTIIKYNEDNSATMIDHCTRDIIRKYDNYTDVNPSVYYLDMNEGECLIFGKSLYHMSDFRKSKYRYSINLRVIIKDEDGGIPINTSKNCLYNTNLLYRINSNNIKMINNKIYPTMFDLIRML